MKIVINDANILIDLIHLEIIDIFFQLKYLELKITDFVLDELEEEQKQELSAYIANGSLLVIESEENDLLEIANLFSSSNGLSFEDCSVWYYAKKHRGIILTGDGRLRKQTSKDGIEVRGILYIFDQLLLGELMSFELAILKLNQLYRINDRLPIAAKEERLLCWGQSEHFA